MKHKFLFLLLVASIPLVSASPIETLEALLLMEEPSENRTECYHVLKEARDYEIELEDGFVGNIGYWYTGVSRSWKPGERLKVTYHTSYSNNIQFDNVNRGETAWGTVHSPPTKPDTIKRIAPLSFDEEGGMVIVLQNGASFHAPSLAWRPKEQIFVFHQGDHYRLWNLSRNEMAADLRFVGHEKSEQAASMLNIEEVLGRRVLGQKEAIQTVASPLLTYCAHLNDPQAPIAVFLFLGPTGVGKTELAKAVTSFLFKDLSYLIRFDMSHFSESHTIGRLIGSPPGYVNHEDGGQLTEALKLRPKSVVLLDEVEKAHPSVRKFFLPVFDEGYVTDSSNTKIRCNDVIFVMTSNIAAVEIAKLYHAGFSSEAILTRIEPILMTTLSPELYNRVIPVIFSPLTEESMSSLVELMLREITQRLKTVKKISLTLTDSAKQYLMVKGFHPTLGARPLKRLIQKKVVTTISQAIVAEGIPEGVRLVLSYTEHNDQWHVEWY